MVSVFSSFSLSLNSIMGGGVILYLHWLSITLEIFMPPDFLVSVDSVINEDSQVPPKDNSILTIYSCSELLSGEMSYLQESC